MSGHPRYNIHANDIDFQIEADFIGLMSPGLPQESNKYCDRVGRVMNHGDGLYGGMFISGMYTAAFFERDVRRVVAQGLACLPSGSGYARLIKDVLDWSAAYPDDWKKTWQRIEEKWDTEDSCPDGALKPFNIDAKLNGAYIALGLLYDRLDFAGRWKSRRAPGRTRTATRRPRAGSSASCSATAGFRMGGRAAFRRWPTGSSTTRPPPSTTSAARRCSVR